MFSVEVRINGSMIGHIYGHNEGFTNNSKKYDECNYTYQYYDVQEGIVYSGEVKHERQDGIEELLKRILQKQCRSKVKKDGS